MLQFRKFLYFVCKVFTEIKLNVILFGKIKQNKVKRDFIWKKKQNIVTIEFKK
jgi:hypothetical protein